jgi:hypothetical protein
MEQVSLREANNKVTIVGVLKEKVLEIKTGDKGRYISGYIIIQTDENSAHRVNVYASEKTKEQQKDNPVYKGLVTANNTHVSIADCMQNNWDVNTATKVVVSSGRLGLNEYYDENGELHSSWSVSSNYINRFREDTKNPYRPVAQFDIEGFITAIRENEDSNVFIELAVPIYGGRVIPMTFSTTNEAGQYILNNFNRGDSAGFRGNLVNIAERKVEKKQGFGEAREDVTIKYVRALVVNAGEEYPYDPDDDKKSWTSQSIKMALKERQTYLEELKAKSTSKGASAKTATPKTANPKTQDFDF